MISVKSETLRVRTRSVFSLLSVGLNGCPALALGSATLIDIGSGRHYRGESAAAPEVVVCDQDGLLGA